MTGIPDDSRHVDLKSTFRTNSREIDAAYVFVNRNDEREAFDAALGAHEAVLAEPDFDVQDVVRPRRNVLVYHGVGGIGKTTLSRHLERRLHGETASVLWPPLVTNTDVVLTTRIDLSAEVSLDFETIILLLRASVARLHRPMYAFDLALSRYWEMNHPGEDLASHIRATSALARFRDALRIPDQISGAIQEIAGALGTSSTLSTIVSQTAMAVVTAVHSRVRRNRAVRECSRLAAILNADADIESLSYYSHLLAWDLASLGSGGKIIPIVFLDTFEAINRTGDRYLERLIQRIVWLMPNALFVVTGRNRLDWAADYAADQLDWSGAVCWPGLHSGFLEQPRQNLVGFLSRVDSDLFLQGRLRRSNQALIGSSLRSQIVDSSGGLPLYLDLAVARFLQIESSGRAPETEDFQIAFPVLVERILRDLGADERRALRAASLFDAFDSNLIQVTAGLESDAPVNQLTGRAFVRHDTAAEWDYSMHELFRAQIRLANVGADSWTPNDWRRAAARGFSELGNYARRARGTGDRRLLIDTLNQGLRLAFEHDLEMDWCVDAAFWFIEDSAWEPTFAPRIPGTEPSSADLPTNSAQAFTRVLTAVVERQRQDRSIVLNALELALSAGLLVGDARDLAEYYRAECLRNLGRGQESLSAMRALVRPDCRMKDGALKGVCQMQRRLGLFRDLDAALLAYPDDVIRWRLRGELLWSQALFDDSRRACGEARDLAESAGRLGDAAEAAAVLAFAAAFANSSDAPDLISSARDNLRRVRNRWAELQLDLAIALTHVGHRGDVDGLCANVVASANENGLTSSAAYAELVRAFDAAVRADTQELQRRRAALAEHINNGEFHYLVEIADFWTFTEGGVPGHVGSDWLDGPEQTAARWQSLVSTRR